jgi:RNA polymerase sigma-70 factor (ECF subfamily)
MDKQKTQTTDNTGKVWEEFSTHLRNFILKRVQNKDDAEDILQEVFLKIHRNIAHLKEEDKLRAWIYQITRNAIIDYYRSKKPVTELSEIPQLKDETPPTSNSIQELDSCLTSLINQLPQKYGQAVTLNEFDGLTQKQIAEKLDLSLPGAKSRVQRGRKKLKEMLLDHCRFEYDRLGNIIADHEQSENCSCGSN